MQNRFLRSNLELRGPRKNLKIGPPSSRAVRSAPFSAQSPNLPTKAWIVGVRSRQQREVAGSSPQRANP
eukprot:13629044-Alexandrium_andersonii.AAC.1